MKAWKLMIGFVIFYFFVTAFNGMIEFAKFISLGNQWIEYGFYVFIAILFLVYFVFPLLYYMAKPSLTNIESMFNGNKKALVKVRKYFIKILSGDDKKTFGTYSLNQPEEIKKWVKEYLLKQINEFDTIIMQHAVSISTTVMISPNAFIDGITIILGNFKMMYVLTKKANFRYSWKELVNMYFSTMSIASFTGLLEEFDDELEAVLEEIAEEFNEFISEEAGTSIGDSIPFLNVLIKTASPIIQASRNYSYVTYNGKRFSCTILNTFSEVKLTPDEIKKKARKEARKARKNYLQELIKKIGINGTNITKEQIGKIKIGADQWMQNTKNNMFHKKDQSSKSME